MTLRRMCVLVLPMAFLTPLAATTVASLAFDEVVARSEAIVHGKVVRSWASWDPDHTAIWTHYEIRIEDALKGRFASTITISEPGGEIDGQHMQVVGAPRYEVGEEAVVFAALTPIGYLRTCGWEQGKFAVRPSAGSPSGRVVRSAAFGARLVPAQKSPGVSSSAAASLDGADLAYFLARVRAEVAAQAAAGRR